VAAGLLACERFSAQAIILDDGFQHLRLRRDLDIVLINAADPFGNMHLLPRGILREPLIALERAGMLMVTKADAQPGAADMAGLLHRLSPEASLFTASYKIACLRDAATRSETAPERLAGAKVAALCSIGDPEHFIRMLYRAGMIVAERLVYPDHHSYRDADYAAIRQTAARLDAVVTTEKDIAKLDTRMLQNCTLIIMEIEQHIEPAAAFLHEALCRSGLR
jgi:tetraacyldisaccharide 4'-kinase